MSRKKSVLHIILIACMFMSLMPAMAMAESLTMYQPFELDGIPLVQFSDMEYPSDEHSAQLTNVDMFEMDGVPVIVAPPSAGASPFFYKLDLTTLQITAAYTSDVPSGYDKYGKTILADDGNIYTMVGYHNLEENPDKVVLKIFKISSTTFQVLGTAAIKGGWANMTDEQRMQQSVSKPFVGGNGTMEYLNGKIYINIGKEGFQDNSGVVHQANMNYTVDCATMTANFGIDGQFNYASHSLNQKMLIDGDKVVTVDHGDALPSRSLLLTVFDGGTPRTQAIMDMPLGTSGDNNTGLAVTGLAATGSHYWITGTSRANWDNSAEPAAGNSRNKNVFLIKVDKSTLAVQTNWIYAAASNRFDYAVKEPRLVDLGNGKLFLIFTRLSYVTTHTRYAIINSDGTISRNDNYALPAPSQTSIQPVVLGNDLLVLGKTSDTRGNLIKINVANPLTPVLVPSSQALPQPAEQFSLTPGETYYFNVASSVNKVVGTINPNVPDASFTYTPFTYVGTINGYNLDYTSRGQTTATNNVTVTPRSLFVADYNLFSGMKWYTLLTGQTDSLMYGEDYGNNYTIRSLTGGSQAGGAGRFGTPRGNEWDAIIAKDADYIKNLETSVATWCQDNITTTSDWYPMRGAKTVESWTFGCNSHSTNIYDTIKGAFRPVLEVKNPAALGPDGLTAITLNLNGGTFDGKNAIKIVCNGAAYAVPTSKGIKAPSGLGFFGWNTESDGSGTPYNIGDAAIPKTVTALYAQWGETSEQFKLRVGEPYYFNLSTVKTDLDKIDGIAYHTNLPNTSLVLLPFTYVGTINAYNLSSAAKITAADADAKATPRSLFVSDYNIAKATWNELYGQGLIYDKAYMDGAMRLRAMTGGVVEFYGGSYITATTKNEWEQILDKTKPDGMTEDWIKNQFPVATPQEPIWCQDPEPDNTLYRAVRGMRDDSWIQSWLPGEKQYPAWWRPVIEVLNPAALGEDGLQVVTFDLNGGTCEGGKTEFRVICAGDSYQVPGRYLKGFTNPPGITGTTFFYNSKRDGSGINYKVGSTVPGTVTTLYAQYTGDKATMLTTALPEGMVGIEYDFNLEATGPEPIEWRLTSTNYKLPQGLVLKDNRIFGIPTEAGEKTLKFLADNPAGWTFGEELVLKINPNPESEIVTAAKLAAENATYANTTQIAHGTQEALENYVKEIALAAINNHSLTVTINTDRYIAPKEGTSAKPNGTAGSYAFTVTAAKGHLESTSAKKTLTIAATAFTGISDAEAVTAAKQAAETAIYANTTQTAHGDQTAVGNYVKGIAIAARNDASVTVTVNTVNYTAPVKGTSTNPNGTAGSYTFTVTATKGIQKSTTTQKTITIAATVFSGLSDSDAVAASIQAAENATYAATTQATHDSLATIKNYVKDIAMAAINNTSITVTINTVKYTMPIKGTSTSPNGRAGSYAFTITAKNGSQVKVSNQKMVSITATAFADIPDAEAVTAAKQAAENATYANTSQTANGTPSAVENYVKSIATTAVNNENVTVTINPVSYTAPIHGTSSDPDGTAGSYTFTITAAKGTQKITTTQKTVTITATEFKVTSDAEAVAAAMAAIVNGSVEVTADADQTAITAAVQTYVNGLLTGEAAGVSAVVTFISGNTYNVAFTKGTSLDSAERTFEIITLPNVDECFIATAAFGSKFDWPVTILRHFRDQYLLTNPLGTALVNFYYQNSPPLAATITSSQPLKILVRLLLAPVIAGVYLIYHPLILVTALFLLIAFFAVRRMSGARHQTF
ncbi:MAG: hypothetical protein GX808_06075 [Syntrophomonadaceae bacterium]|nr:hypothetical protein [Syntrophomonadaceae bacterium]